MESEPIMTTVWVPNDSTHDFDPAKEYGEIIYLTRGRINRFSTSKLYREFVDKMKDSTEKDYLILTGLTMLNVLAAAILVLKYKRLNLLIYKTTGVKGGYIERVIKFGEGEED